MLQVSPPEYKPEPEPVVQWLAFMHTNKKVPGSSSISFTVYSTRVFMERYYFSELTIQYLLMIFKTKKCKDIKSHV